MMILNDDDSWWLMISLDVVFQEDFPLSSCLKPEGSSWMMMMRRRRRDRGMCLRWWWWGGEGILRKQSGPKKGLWLEGLYEEERRKVKKLKKAFAKLHFCCHRGQHYHSGQHCQGKVLYQGWLGKNSTEIYIYWTNAGLVMFIWKSRERQGCRKS